MTPPSGQPPRSDQPALRRRPRYACPWGAGRVGSGSGCRPSRAARLRGQRSPFRLASLRCSPPKSEVGSPPPLRPGAAPQGGPVGPGPSAGRCGSSPAGSGRVERVGRRAPSGARPGSSALHPRVSTTSHRQLKPLSFCRAFQTCLGKDRTVFCYASFYLFYPLNEGARFPLILYQ